MAAENAASASVGDADAGATGTGGTGGSPGQWRAMQIAILRVLNVLPSKMNIKIEIFKGICVAGAFCGVKVSVQDESMIYVLRKSGCWSSS